MTTVVLGRNTIVLEDGAMLAAVGLHPGKPVFLDVPFTLSNATAAASFALSNMCATLKCAKEYCSSPAAFKHMFDYTLMFLNFGHRIVDLEYEIKRRWVTDDKLMAAANQLPTRHVLFLQAGAHVGALDNDPVFPLLISNPLARGILLEPGDVQFAGLRYNYRNIDSRVKLVNSAFCTSAGYQNFFHGNGPACWHSGECMDMDVVHQHTDGPLYHYLYRTHTSQMGGLGSRWKMEILADEEFGGSTPVSSQIHCIDDLTPLILETEWGDNWPGINETETVLVVDAEGYDMEVLHHVIFSKTFQNAGLKLPALVYFEYSNIPSKSFGDAMSLMDAAGYICELATPTDIICNLQMGHFANRPVLKDKQVNQTDYHVLVNGKVEVLPVNAGVHPENAVAAFCMLHAIINGSCAVLLGEVRQVWWSMMTTDD